MTRTKPEGGGPRSKKLKATATGQIPFNSQFLSDAFQRVVDAAGSAQEALKQGHGYAGLEALVSAALRLGPIKVAYDGYNEDAFFQVLDKALGDQDFKDSLTDAMLLLMRYSLQAAYFIFLFLSKQESLPQLTRSYLDVLRCAAELLMHIRKGTLPTHQAHLHAPNCTVPEMDQQAAAKHSEDRHKIEEGFVINGGCVVELCKSVKYLVEGLVGIAHADGICPNREPQAQAEAAYALVSSGLLSEILAFHQVPVFKMHPSWPADTWGFAHAHYLTPALQDILSFIQMYAHDNTSRLLREDENEKPTWNLAPRDILGLPTCALTLAFEVNMHPAISSVYLTCMRALLQMSYRLQDRNLAHQGAPRLVTAMHNIALATVLLLDNTPTLGPIVYDSMSPDGECTGMSRKFEDRLRLANQRHQTSVDPTSSLVQNLEDELVAIRDIGETETPDHLITLSQQMVEAYRLCDGCGLPLDRSDGQRTPAVTQWQWRRYRQCHPQHPPSAGLTAPTADLSLTAPSDATATAAGASTQGAASNASTAARTSERDVERENSVSVGSSAVHRSAHAQAPGSRLQGGVAAGARRGRTASVQGITSSNDTSASLGVSLEELCQDSYFCTAQCRQAEQERMRQVLAQLEEQMGEPLLGLAQPHAASSGGAAAMSGVS